MINYEITVNEGDKSIKVSLTYNKCSEEREYKYRGYGFGRMTNRFSDSPQVFIIETQDGKDILFNLNNISSISYI